MQHQHSEPGQRNNKETRRWAQQLTRGHRASGFMLLACGFLMATIAGAAPLALDLASNQAVAALPYPHTQVIVWGITAGQAGFAVLLALLVALLCAPLRLGREAWYFGGADARKRSRARIFFWLQPRWAVKATGFVVSLALRKLMWAMLYFLPGGFLLVGTLWQAQGSEIDLSLFLGAIGGGAALLALGLVFYSTTVQRYALVLPILAKQPRCKLRNAVRLSVARTNNHCKALLCYKLSLLPWYLLCMLIIPLPFVAPYITQARACRHAELLQGGV